MKAQLIIICFVLSKTLYAQKLTGRVSDSGSGVAVGYASVGLTKSNKGTTAKSDGNFELDYQLYQAGDSLVISCVGYKTIKLPVEDKRHSYDVRLEKTDPLLKAVIIRHYSKKLMLDWNGGKSNLSIVSNQSLNSHTQVARLMEAPRAFTRLESVTVATTNGNIFYRYKAARFRIRIYDYDTTLDQPGTELCDSVIEVFGRGMLTVKLDRVHITIPQKHFFVSVQYLFIEENLEESKIAEPPYKSYTYRPGIGMSHVVDKGNTWVQYPDLSWRKLEYDLSLTATVSY